MSDELSPPDGIREYSELEVNLSQLFAKEYLKCYDSEVAALAMGYSDRLAASIGNRFLKDPLVRRFIHTLEVGRKANPVTEDDGMSEVSEHEQWQRRIRAKLMREACDRGRGSSHAARVTALGLLARSHGMLESGFQIGRNEEAAEDETVGGVLIVESVKNEDEWQTRAIEHSKTLKGK